MVRIVSLIQAVALQQGCSIFAQGAQRGQAFPHPHHLDLGPI